jgi:uncharacterized membrane protein YhaH (DUF805 family)
MRFVLGFLLGYYIRGNKPVLAATLTVIAVVFFIILPAMALSQLALSVRRERLSRPHKHAPLHLLASTTRQPKPHFIIRSSPSVSWPIVTILRLNPAKSSFKHPKLVNL